MQFNFSYLFYILLLIDIFFIFFIVFYYPIFEPPKTICSLRVKHNFNSPSLSTSSSILRNSSSEKTGIIIFLHNPKTGGNYIRYSIGNQFRKINSGYYTPFNKSLNTVKSEIYGFLRNKFYDKLIFYEHHHYYPTFNETLPIYLDYKQQVEEQGYVCDIIYTFRDALGLSISAYNYNFKQETFSVSHYLDNTLQNYQISYYYHQIGGTFNPWDKYEKYYPYPIIDKFSGDLENMDFIFFTDNLIHFEAYLYLKFNIKWIPGITNKSPSIMKKEYFTMDSLNTMLKKQSIDQLAVTQERKIGNRKFIDFLKQYI